MCSIRLSSSLRRPFAHQGLSASILRLPTAAPDTKRGTFSRSQSLLRHSRAATRRHFGATLVHPGLDDRQDRTLDVAALAERGRRRAHLFPTVHQAGPTRSATASTGGLTTGGD